MPNGCENCFERDASSSNSINFHNVGVKFFEKRENSYRKENSILLLIDFPWFHCPYEGFDVGCALKVLIHSELLWLSDFPMCSCPCVCFMKTYFNAFVVVSEEETNYSTSKLQHWPLFSQLAVSSRELAINQHENNSCNQ